MFEIHISSLKFMDENSVILQKDSVLIIIGPNNSGKSATLKAIVYYIDKGKTHFPLSELTLKVETPLETVEQIMEPLQNTTGGYQVGGTSFDHSHIKHFWREKGGIGPFTQITVSNLSTQNRLIDCDPPKNFDARKSFSAVHPFQRMYRDRALERKASETIKRAFKSDLVIHRFNSSTIPAYIGLKPDLSKDEFEGDLSYCSKVEALEKIEEQGDGVRSFVSILGRVLTEARPIQLIDEPEAFLHPPQAKMIGEEIVKNSTNRQTIIATHSSDVLRGVLAKGHKEISVVRITKKEGIKVNYLKNEDIASLWKDAILRFSNLFDGLFHDAVVITEGDADCRFYESLFGAMVQSENIPDLHYAYSGGKDRIPVLVKALSVLSVPVVSILDFDVMNDEHPLKEIFEAHGGDWSDIKEDWTLVKSSVEQKKNFIGGDEFRSDIQEQLKEYGTNTVVPREVLRRIREITRSASPWDNAKKAGKAIIDSGQPTQAIERLLDTLSERGVFVVPVGEMEGFCKSIGGHGRRWVEEVLKKDLAGDNDMRDARDFALAIIAWLNRA